MENQAGWYIVCKQDRTVHPDLERFLAKRMGATTIEIDSSHVAMLSHPDVVFETIIKAANGIHRNYDTATSAGRSTPRHNRVGMEKRSEECCLETWPTSLC